MGFLSGLFGEKAPPASQPRSRLHEPSSRNLPTSQNATRRELLRVVLRDTMIKHGIPSAWLGAEMLATSGGGQAPGMHVRLLVKHWDPRLLSHGVALQNSFLQRVALFDPAAPEWLTGVSWQFALSDESVCPAMPDPSVWTTPARPVPTEDDQLAELRRVLAAGDGRQGDSSAYDKTQPFRPTEPAGL